MNELKMEVNYIMLSKAIEKIKSELLLNGTNQFVQVVGSFLIGHLGINPNDAEKIMVLDKTITLGVAEMWKVAKTKKVNNYAGMDEQEAMKIIFKYFEIKSLFQVSIQNTAPIVKPKVEFKVNLKDFL